MWKIQTPEIKEEIYYSLEYCGLFLEEQIGYCNGTRGPGDLPYTYQHILKAVKTRWKNVAMA